MRVATVSIPRRSIIVLTCASLAVSALCGTIPATIAVVGLKTYAPPNADCAWVGVAVGEGIAARLTRGKTGIQQVERVDVATILRMRGLPPVENDGKDEKSRKRTAEAMRHLSELEDKISTARSGLVQAGDGAPTQTLPTLSNRLLSASHLIVGDVVADKPWGQGGNILATIRVARVGNGTLLENSGATAREDATVEGLQKLECDLAGKLCVALEGDITAADLKPHGERPGIYQHYAEARRLLLEGRYDAAIKLSAGAWDIAGVSLDLLPDLMRTQAEAYRGAIEEARRAGSAAKTGQLQEEWKQKATEMQAAYDRATAEGEAKGLRAGAGGVYERAEFLQFAGQDAEAVPRYQQAVTLGKDDADTWFGLAYSLHNTGDLPSCIMAYDRALALKPDFAGAYNNRGNAHAAKHDYGRAIADYTKAIALRPDGAEVYYNRGIAYAWGRNDYDHAIADFDKAIVLRPNYGDAYTNRGNTHVLKRDYGHAVVDFDKAVALKHDEADAYDNRGSAYFHRHDYHHAIADYTKAIALKPDSAEAYCNLGVALLADGKDDEAVDTYRRLVQIDALKALNAVCKSGLTALLTEDHWGFQRPQHILAHFCFGLVYEGAGKRAEAVAEYRAYVVAATAAPVNRFFSSPPQPPPEGKYVCEARRNITALLDRRE